VQQTREVSRSSPMSKFFFDVELMLSTCRPSVYEALLSRGGASSKSKVSFDRTYSLRHLPMQGLRWPGGFMGSGRAGQGGLWGPDPQPRPGRPTRFMQIRGLRTGVGP
jgi:hypothetical protein